MITGDQIIIAVIERASLLHRWQVVFCRIYINLIGCWINGVRIKPLSASELLSASA